ncbi:MAG TPA: DUF3313 domain-containing protein [Syntrophorhabdaceae bacterium]|nr:DUF3313 domain-containing protein [Syntrophorhabdaceae bacterium]
MTTRTGSFIIVLAVFALLAGCASMPQTALEDKEASLKVKPSSEFHNTLIYVRPGVDANKYKKFYIDTVQIYRGPDAQFGNVTEEKKQKMAGFIRDEFVRVLKKDFEVVDRPGPGVLRIRFILAGIQETVPPLAAVTHALPAGLVMNLGLSAAHMKGSFIGSVVFGGEFFDGETGKLEAAFLTKNSPNAMDITTVFTGLDAAKQAVTDTAEKFREVMVKMQKEKKQVR